MWLSSARLPYGNIAPEEADVIVALGGDGLMLQTLHRTMNAPKPIYGMNRGSVGFLMNEYSEYGLPERLAAARPSIIHPLAMRARDIYGAETIARAINEVSLLRQTYQAAKLCIEVDGATRLGELIADGVLMATPAGSTAYNLSANGPILPLGAPLMALTPLSPFRPRRWRGALLPTRRGSSSSLSRPTSARSRPPPTISKSAASIGSRWRWTGRRRSFCSTIRAIRSTSASCASSSDTSSAFSRFELYHAAASSL